MGKHSKSKPDDSDKKNPKLNENFKRNPNGLIVWVICSIGIFVVLFSLISVVFPGLIISVVDVNPFGEPFEIGAMGIPLLIVNISGNRFFRCSKINEKTIMFIIINGIPIVPISNGSPNRFTSTIEITSPGNTIDTLLSKTTINPNEKIIKLIEFLEFFST